MRFIVALGTVGTLLLGAVAPAEAKHRPQNYCSESSDDLCLSTRRVDGVRRLRITLSIKYFRMFKLCVNPPADAPPACERFRIRKLKDGFGRSVRWRKHFPDFGTGAYTVTWRRAGGRMGRRLGFHV